MRAESDSSRICEKTTVFRSVAIPLSLHPSRPCLFYITHRLFIKLQKFYRERAAHLSDSFLDAEIIARVVWPAFPVSPSRAYGLPEMRSRAPGGYSLPLKSWRKSFMGAGGTLATIIFSSTCERWLMPMRAVATPGVDRTN